MPSTCCANTRPPAASTTQSCSTRRRLRKSKRAQEGALRGYKELNLRALKMLTPGGTLVTCSCSHHVSAQEFTGVLASAAADARRRVQVLETRGAAPDHPAILTLPETTYLKCIVCRVD